MSAAQEPERAEAGQPAAAEPADAPEPEPSHPPRSDDAPPPAQDDLADESVAPEAWAGEPDGRDDQPSEDLPTFGDAARLLGKPAVLAAQSGDKLAIGKYATSIEQVAYYLTGTTPSQVRSGRLAADVVESIADTYVGTADHDVLRHTLQRHRVAYASGAAGSGRLTTAYAVLAELCGCDKIAVIDLNDEADLSTVLDQDGVLREGHGHVLELPANRPAPRKNTLAAAGGRLDSEHGYLVVVGPPGSTDRMLDPYEVPHQPPAPAEVLDRQLPHLLSVRTNWSADRIAAFVASCHHAAGVARQLHTVCQPGEVVQLARRLVDVGLRGGQPDEALELLPDALRELAGTVLRAANEDGDVHTLRRLTARIAYGLFSGRPLTVVFELASLLFAALPPEEQAESQLVRTVFDGGMESLIDERMRAKPNDEDADGDRMARLVHPELALAVLDVVWHEFDHLRAPVLEWLRVLGGDPRQSVRTRTGQLAGQLALYDFGEAYRELVRPWARSRGKVHRQSAAWAMERAVLEPKLTARVCGQVRDWVYSSDPFLNDTAARCYATRLGAEFADEPLTHLWLVALRGEQVVSPAVAQAVARLHQPDDVDSGLVILTELAGWTGDRARCLQVHAARSLIFLAHRAAAAPHERWPALLRQAFEHEETRDLLVELWRAALTELMVAARGWQALLMWLLRPDEPDELQDFTVGFAADLLRTPVLRHRADFHLSQWLRRYPEASVLPRLRQLLKGSS